MKQSVQQTIANLLVNDVLALEKKTGVALRDSKLTPRAVAEIALMLDG
jgi:Asp-tRNA(Asn)/Glu-tRNA(Gln) amidotransferase B subunit